MIPSRREPCMRCARKQRSTATNIVPEESNKLQPKDEQTILVDHQRARRRTGRSVLRPRQDHRAEKQSTTRNDSQELGARNRTEPSHHFDEVLLFLGRHTAKFTISLSNQQGFFNICSQKAIALLHFPTIVSNMSTLLQFPATPFIMHDMG